MTEALLCFIAITAISATTASTTCPSTAEIKSALPRAALDDISIPIPSTADEYAAAKRKFQRYGVLLVRSLQQQYSAAVLNASRAAFERSLELLDAGKVSPVQNDEHLVGWVTPDQTLFIPAPAGHVRDKQAMVLALDYFSDATALAVATDGQTLDILSVLLGSPNVEIFGKGQCFYKEGVPNATSAGGVTEAMMGTKSVADLSVSTGLAPGGNPKYLHQDSAYFMFANQGAVATFSYVVPTGGDLDNGPLHVVPGSHQWGHLPHVDTPSHLGTAGDWSFADALRIDGEPGDTVFFHIHTLHGSTPNRSPHPRPVAINRYIEASDYQIYFATDAKMRERAKAEYEEGLKHGRLPPKERGIMVRGTRAWNEAGPAWKIDARVNH